MASSRLVSAEAPRRGRGAAATRLREIFTSRPRRRRDASPRNLHVAAAAPPRFIKDPRGENRSRSPSSFLNQRAASVWTRSTAVWHSKWWKTPARDAEGAAKSSGASLLEAPQSTPSSRFSEAQKADNAASSSQSAARRRASGSDASLSASSSCEPRQTATAMPSPSISRTWGRRAFPESARERGPRRSGKSVSAAPSSPVRGKRRSAAAFKSNRADPSTVFVRPPTSTTWNESPPASRTCDARLL